MTVKITERDQKLLAFLGFFCVVVIMVVMVNLPLCAANKSLKEQIDRNQEQISEMESKEARLPFVRALNEDAYVALSEVQKDLYPMLKSQEIDRLLTDKVISYGLTATKLQIIMPEEAADVTGYGMAGSGGSNPTKEDAVWIAVVSLDVAGSMAAMDELIDELSQEAPGIRLVDIRWNQAELKGNMQLEVIMSRKD